jgi:hypothetical protein
MAVRQLRRASIVLAASLVAVGLPLCFSAATGAQTVASVGVSLPSVGVSLPSIGVSLPGVSVSTPEVNVATPQVTVATPEVSVSTSSSPGSESTEITVAGSSPTSPTGGGSSGAGGGSGSGAHGSGEGSGEDTSGADGSSSGAHSPPPVGADTAGNTSVAGASEPASAEVAAGLGGKSVGVGASRSPAGARPSNNISERAHHHNGVATAASAEARQVAVGSLSPREGPVRDLVRAATKHTNNPLNTIGRHIPLPLPVPNWSKPIILVLLLLAIWFAVRSRAASRRVKRVEAQRAALLQDVGAMQAALVPVVPARVGGLAVSVAYRPADGPAAGGDFYDVFVPERGKVAIVLGDVAGHGHQALSHAALTRYTLRAYLQAGLEPRAALALTGRVLGDRKLEHFATVAVAIYHAREGRLVYASAGHPAPILHGLQTREPLVMCASPPIGWTVPTGRRQTTVSLPPGAVACFFSDGLVEARCEDDLLGRERLSEIVAALGRRPDAAKLLSRVRAAADSTPDDMVACVVTPEMTIVPTRTHIEELEADARDLARGDVRRFLETCQVLNPDIEQAVERAGDIAAAFGTALLRVELAPSTATVSVTAPRPTTEARSPQRLPHPVGEPSGAR